eukprot:1145786-Pelagomonas_calceolata.AAC.4
MQWSAYNLKECKEQCLAFNRKSTVTFRLLMTQVPARSILINLLAPHTLEKTSFNSHHRDQAWALLVTLLIPNGYSFLLVEGMHGALALDILVPLIGVGSAFTACSFTMEGSVGMVQSAC